MNGPTLKFSRLERRLRRGFSLLEVMIAAAVLVVAISIVARIQTATVEGVTRAQKIVVATDLAREKMAETLLLIEAEGLGLGDVRERGDFRDHGQEARLDYGRTLEDYRWEYHVEEIDFALNPEIFALLGGASGEQSGPSMGGGGMAESMMNQFGLGGDQMSRQLGQFVRRVRVRVYWGEERSAEEKGREIVLTTHIISPQGAFNQMGGAAGGAPGGPAGPGGAPGMGGPQRPGGGPGMGGPQRPGGAPGMGGPQGGGQGGGGWGGFGGGLGGGGNR